MMTMFHKLLEKGTTIYFNVIPLQLLASSYISDIYFRKKIRVYMEKVTKTHLKSKGMIYLFKKTKSSAANNNKE